MKPDAIVLHHSVTKDGVTKDFDAIARFHTSWRFEDKIVTEVRAHELISQGYKVEPPWKAIGYHYLIELVGIDYLALGGRPESTQGAHCNQGGMNSHSLGICFVGNFDLGPVPNAQWKVGLELVIGLCLRYGIPPDKIYGHHQFAPYKTCPGTQFELSRFRFEVGDAILTHLT